MRRMIEYDEKKKVIRVIEEYPCETKPLIFYRFGGASGIGVPPEAIVKRNGGYNTVRYGWLSYYDVIIPCKRYTVAYRGEHTTYYILETKSGVYLLRVFWGTAEDPASMSCRKLDISFEEAVAKYRN